MNNLRNEIQRIRQTEKHMFNIRILTEWKKNCFSDFVFFFSFTAERRLDENHIEMKWISTEDEARRGSMRMNAARNATNQQTHTISLCSLLFRSILFSFPFCQLHNWKCIQNSHQFNACDATRDYEKRKELNVMRELCEDWRWRRATSDERRRRKKNYRFADKSNSNGRNL